MNRFRTMTLMTTILGLAALAMFLGADASLNAQAKKEGKKGLDVGLINLKKIAKTDLTLPKDDKVPMVGLKASIAGMVEKGEKLNVYLIVCPAGSSDAKDSFWVQKTVTRTGEKFKGECQFGEGDLGKGEIFAVIGITSSKDLADGEQMDFAALQKAATSFSPVLFVKRKN